MITEIIRACARLFRLPTNHVTGLQRMDGAREARFALYAALRKRGHSYKKVVHFAEAGRACCEFLLAKAMERGIKVGIAQGSSLLDTNEPIASKLYGYHRLAEPLVVGIEDDKFVTKKYSEIKDSLEPQEPEYRAPEALRT